MHDVFEYIEWRGDISMVNDPVNDVDMLILTRLSYIPFGGVVPSLIKNEHIALNQAAQAVLDLADHTRIKFKKREDQKLLEVLIDSPRFSNIQLSYFTDIYNEEQAEQFSAITMELEDNMIAVIYRGTDGTLVGWKEDFNMSFSPEVPAQKDAVKYLECAADYFPAKKIRVAGHSKGGNLSMYAASFCRTDIQNRIIAVRNFDGPGFNEYQASADDFFRISDITLTYLPESSIIGMLLEHMEKSIVVGSQSLGALQHNTYLWEIRRSSFLIKEELNSSSHIIDHTLKDWLASLTPEQRERMIDGIFQVLQSSNGKTLRDLWNGKNAVSILSTVVKLDPETKNNINVGMTLLRKALKNNINAKHMINKMIAE